MDSERWLLLGVVLLTAGVAMWGWWIHLVLQRRRRLRTWPRVGARVVEAVGKREVAVSQTSRTSYVVTRGRYEFSDPAGNHQTGSSKLPKGVGEGDLVEVMHDPDTPATHEVAVPRVVWAELLLMLLLSILPFGFGVIALMLGLGYA